MTEDELRVIAERCRQFEGVPFLSQGHRHLEKGCMCGSCEVETGVVIHSGARCDEHEHFGGVWESSCDVSVLTWDQADHLIKSEEEIHMLLREIARLVAENKRLVERLSNGFAA